MVFVLIFILATAALIILFLIKMRAMRKDPESYADRLEKSSEWFSVHPETLSNKARTVTNTVVKPALHKSLVVGFAVYKNTSIALTKFLRKKFYDLLHYSLKRDEQKPTTGKRLRDVHENGNQ